MSWELVSFLILAGVLLGGFAWYERSRPPAQVVALVAALAALAIAGRIAFAAFPNVKPTTDIVVFAGFALGAAPGFAVGALAALVSNFWFGQGPWTPWQMAGWGLCGVLGALVGVGFRNAGRLTLAATCGIAGLAYGALLNFSLMATYGGELSWERYGVLAARAIPFDAAHVIGNVVLALLAGPAIVRMLTRFRRRFEWHRGDLDEPQPSAGPRPPEPGRRRLRPAFRGGGFAVFAAALLLLAALAPAPARAAGPESAAAWLRSVQNADGGFGSGPGEDSGTEMTAWAMLGLAAAGTNPYDVEKGGRNPVGYLRAHVKELESPGDLARTIIALLAAGADPRAIGGRNLVAELHRHRRQNGSYLGWPNSTAFAVIALRAARSPGGTEKSLEWLRKVQNDDGGWGIEAGVRSDAESTGAVLQALSPDSKAAGRGLQYLRDAQQSNGGYRVGGNGPVNSPATGWAVQGMIGAGAKAKSFKRGGSTPFDYIAANQAPDGHYRYSKSSDQTPIWVTGQVLVAASGKSFPIEPPPRAKKPEGTSRTNQSSAGTGGAAPVGPAPSLGAEAESAVGGSAGAGAGAPPPEAGVGAGTAADDGTQAGGGEVPGAERGSETGDATAAGQSAPGSGSAEQGRGAAAPAGEDDGSDSGVAGAILIGLLAGCVLFGLGLLGRKGWMRWRYGL